MSTEFVIKSSDSLLLERATRVAGEFAQPYAGGDMVGIVFQGAIARGYFDDSADIDIAFFKRRSSEVPLSAKFVEVEGLEILANEVILLIDGNSVTFDKWQLHTKYQVMTFEIGAGGETVPVPTDCISDARTRLRSADLTLNPENGRIRGTVTIRDLSDMTGSECPFGGGSRDVIRQGEATGTFRDGALELTLFFPTIPEAYETTLQIRAVTG